jgi:hypothetical protein
MGTANVTLYAKWAQNYTITFDKNDAGATGTMSPQTIASGSSAILTANAFTKTGSTFTGWATTPTGAVVYGDGASYTMGTTNVTLYAKWYWTANLNLRDTGPAGGLIFYINPNYAIDGWRYLEAAPVDQISRAWGTYNHVVPGAGGTAIGTGKQNTLAIIAGDSASYKAADECADYSIVNGGVTYDDWFLPSKDELNQMYVNLKSQGVGGFADNYYWSSSQYFDYTAWLQYFSNGSQSTDDKYDTHPVRAVRAF